MARESEAGRVGGTEAYGSQRGSTDPTEAALRELGRDRLHPIFSVASGEELLIKNGRLTSFPLGKLEILEETLNPVGLSSPARSEQKETQSFPLGGPSWPELIIK